MSKCSFLGLPSQRHWFIVPEVGPRELYFQQILQVILVGKPGRGYNEITGTGDPNTPNVSPRKCC